VRVEIDGEEGVINEILPRDNELARAIPGRQGLRHVFAANLDRVVVVASVLDPPLRTGFIDRCLAASHLNEIPGMIVINKIDLAAGVVESDVDAIVGVYRAAGLECLRVSVAEGTGLTALTDALRDRTSLVVGQSGVGKSSLINAIEPGLDLRVASVSEASGKGRHTTTASRLIRLGIGGYVVDTPGVRSFGLEPMDSPQVLLAYPEFAPYISSCRFSACTHVHEPGCGVREALGEGAITGWRYDNYVRIIGSMDED